MGTHIHPQLAGWFDQGLKSGRFDVPGGRHIVLNQYPRLMKVSRLMASAGVGSDSLCDFLVALNPNIVTVPDGSAAGMRHQLAIERDELPGLRKVVVEIPPNHKLERWFVYTPPLDVMRQRWNEVRPQLDLPGE